MAFSIFNLQGSGAGTRQEEGGARKKSLLFFFLVLGLAITKDIVDIISHGLTAVGMGLSATVLGAVVGVPIVAISWVISFLVGLFVNFTIATYFFSTGQGVGRRLAIQSIGFIMEMVPFVSLLPLTTATFVLAHFIGKVPNPVVKVAQLVHPGR